MVSFKDEGKKKIPTETKRRKWRQIIYVKRMGKNYTIMEKFRRRRERRRMYDSIIAEKQAE